MKIDVQQYRVYVEPLSADLGGGYVSHAPELKGCISDGASPGEALRNIYEAIGDWIADARANGVAVPTPELLRQYA